MKKMPLSQQLMDGGMRGKALYKVGVHFQFLLRRGTEGGGVSQLYLIGRMELLSLRGGGD